MAPKGWHIPSNEEWSVLTEFLGGDEIEDEDEFERFRYTPTAGGKMKTTGTQYWKSPNEEATNSSGFSVLPGGSRAFFGSFRFMGATGRWWSSGCWYRRLGWGNGVVFRDHYNNFKGGWFFCSLPPELNTLKYIE